MSNRIREVGPRRPARRAPGVGHPNADPLCAPQVWADNLDDELEGLRIAIERYPVVSMVRRRLTAQATWRASPC